MDESWRPILRLFRIYPGSEESIMVFLTIALIVMFFIFMGYIVLNYIRYRKRIEDEWELFFKICEAKDLSVRETELLEDMVHRSHTKYPTSVVKSIQKFDLCVNAEIKRTDITEEEREELIEEIHEVRRKLHFDRFPPFDILRSSRYIEIGQRIRLAIGQNEHKRYFWSKVLINKENRLIAQMPKSEDALKMLKSGIPTNIYFWRWGDAGYIFSTKIIHIDEGPDGEIHLEHSDELIRSQRRLFYRLNIKLLFEYFRLNEEEIKELLDNNTSIPEGDLSLQSARLISISGGGISFISDKYLEKNDILWLRIRLSPVSTITDIYGRVVRTRKAGEGTIKVFVEFIIIPEKIREKIIRFISTKQRERIALK